MTSLVQSVDWVAVAPVLVTALTGLAVLVTDLFLAPRHKPLLGWVTIAGLALAALCLIPLTDGDRATFCLTTGDRQCSYVADHFALAVQLLVVGGALLTALLSVTTVRREALPAGEYWFLLLSSAAGAALLPASRDLATLIVALEVASLPAFALVGLRRGDRGSAEAALKFFLSSVVATAVSLLGVSFVYAATGSLHLDTVAGGLDDVDPRLNALAALGVVLTLVGFAFKLAAVPFHFWVPDSYVGAPLPVAAYLSVVGKSAGFSGLALVTVVAFRPYADTWGPALAVLAALTMTTGNVAALRQRPDQPASAVRLLAWSSVGQAGYLLVPLAAAGYHDDPEEMVGATVAYALMYAVVNLGAFAVVALVAENRPGHRLTDHRALFSRNPLAALTMGFFLLCLAGLPPGVIGLFAKVAVFRTAVDSGLGWLAVVMAVNVTIALYYYLKWTALLFATPTTATPTTTPAARATATTAPAAPTPGTATPGAPGQATAPTATGSTVAGSTATAAREPSVPASVPHPLTAAIALAAALGVALSGAPQLILRLASGTLF
ncbi:NADH-quinone oxidoreductase subunit N [Wenjunlia vitaminophila]|uniref:NADH-quinone oxidoreductase subunit N n=1 Tax=Wenjunlia vitaminophila TaxID=76728 RepID=A0A0T6LXS6_WENVI|nr:NADH-quinone oxidoreductase subunit N [Wenjunlia vitaminophila]KRV50813.1 NADH-quinone oxidoreductase subunit N [Wenjunlia vitaminophila]